MTNTITLKLAESKNVVSLRLSNEVRSSADAFSKARFNFIRNLRNGSEYNTSYGKRAIEVMCPVIEGYLSSLVSAKGQHNNHFWYQVLRPVVASSQSSLTQVADIVALNLVSKLSKQPTFTSIVRSITDAVHNLLDLSFDEREEYLDQSMKLFMGVIQAIQKDTDVILIVMDKDTNSYHIHTTPQWNSLMDEALASINAYTSIYTPMVCEPIPHTDLLSEDGGYLMTRSPLLKRKVKVGGKLMSSVTSFNATNNPEFFEETNRIQSTPFEVNTNLLETIKRYYERGFFFPDFPISLEQKEDIIDAEHKAAVDAQNRLNAYYSQREGIEFKEVGPRGSKKLYKEVSTKWEEAVRKTNDILAQAEFYAGYDKLYFPVYFDSRGRRYTYVPTSSLTYMGTELAKALLLLADKETLTKQGLRQLYYSLGNALGHDKKNLKTKGALAVKWFKQHEKEFINENYSIFFSEPGLFDEPINALAVVLELVEFKKDSSYKSGYIAHRDARCSGASIIGTLLNDEKAMKLTSVLDTDTPSLPDAYTEAAENGRKLNTSEYLASNADELFKRSVWKTPTMTYSAYGSTRSTIHSGREGSGGNKKVFEDLGLSIDHLNSFTELMMNSLNTTLPSCKEYRDAIKDASSTFLKDNDYWGFINPLTGFPVVRRRVKVIEKKLESPGTFQRIRLIIKKNTTELNHRKALTATPPDAIHSLDASILVKVGQKVKKPIATIHDSIGTHPNNVPLIISAYAETMYEMACGNVLDSIFEQLGSKAPSKMGLTEEQLLSIKHSKHILV